MMSSTLELDAVVCLCCCLLVVGVTTARHLKRSFDQQNVRSGFTLDVCESREHETRALLHRGSGRTGAVLAWRGVLDEPAVWKDDSVVDEESVRRQSARSDGRVPGPGSRRHEVVAHLRHARQVRDHSQTTEVR